jgi:hypothetical protein
LTWQILSALSKQFGAWPALMLTICHNAALQTQNGLIIFSLSVNQLRRDQVFHGASHALE